MSTIKDADFYTTVPPPVYSLDATEAFNALGNREKEYIYACSQASWIGSLVDLIQVSPESSGIFLLGQKVFSSQSPKVLRECAKKNGFSDDEIESVLCYFACVYGNLGNYKSFGDTKFIPSISKSRFFDFLSLSDVFQNDRNGAKKIFDEVISSIYSLNPRRLRLDFGPNDGISTYYSANCTRDEAETVQRYLKSAKLGAYNTRLFKEPISPVGKQLYSLKFASARRETTILNEVKDLPPNWTLQLQYGDMSDLMSVLVESIQPVRDKALNAIEAEMWKLYAESFQSGDIEVHKEGSKLWVKDKNPIVETYIGFIESYRDPLGVRAEFEGFVAVVNKVTSAKFQQLVGNAPEIITHLPWPHSYEHDTFSKPDFTSLDVVTFATSGVPLGINIPNYDDVRETDGFKNVSLNNVLVAHFKDPKVEFLAEADKVMYLKNIVVAFEIQVGLHELLGHGSGKLFRRNTDGTFNFDRERVKDLITGGPVEHWYEPGENWDSKFASLSSAMEECRAECVGIYLCDQPKVLTFFGVDPCAKSAGGVCDAVYINWLSMIRSGVTAMEFYSPGLSTQDSGTWRQAHCCARYVILRVLIEADPTVIQIKEVVGPDGAADLSITFDRAKLTTVAKPAIGAFLTKLQYYKSTGNAKDGCQFFSGYSAMSPEHMPLRKIVIDRKKPRPIFVQPLVRQQGDQIELVPYEPTYDGIIQSFVDRFQSLPLGSKALQALETAWKMDLPYFRDIPV